MQLQVIQQAMQEEIDELRDTLQVKSGMWCGIEKKWQEKYEALLRGTPASAWIGVDDRLPDVKPSHSRQLLICCKRAYWETPFVFLANYFNNFQVEEDCSDELPAVLNGWHEKMMNDDGDEFYYPLWVNGDVVTHWQPMPVPPGDQS